MKLDDTTQQERLALMVSDRDRMVSIYRPSTNPIYKHRMELVATATVVSDDDGKISIGVGHDPGDTIEVQFIDDTQDRIG
jgi:hypothetical protein